MSIRPIEGKSSQWLHTEVRWVADASSVEPGPESTVRPATDGEVAFWRTHWSARLHSEHDWMQRLRQTWARRSRHYRSARRAAGRRYAELVAQAPSRRRRVAMVIETTFRLNDWIEESRWDTVRV